MNTTFNTQPLASSVSGTVRSGQTERSDVEQAFRMLATSDNGDPVAGEQQAVVVNISAQGAKQAGSAATTAEPAEADTPEASSTAGAAASGGQAAASAAGGQASAAASGTTAGGASTSSTTAASSTQVYEPADTNEDGTVSPKEQADYDAKLASRKADEKAAEQAATAGRSAEAQAAVKAYTSVEQLGQGGSDTAA